MGSGDVTDLETVEADDAAFPWCRRRAVLNAPHRCVVLNSAGEGLGYFDDIETALAQGKWLAGARTIADAVTGTVFAHYTGPR